MKILALASFVFATTFAAGSASALRMPDPMPPAPGTLAAKRCRVAGAPLFEIRHRSEVKAPTSTVSVYPTGAWTFRAVAKDGTRGPLISGCLAKDELTSVRNALKAAPWTITHQRIRCMAYSPSYTEYVVRGRVKFHEQMCTGDILDETSQASITTIEGILPRH